MTDPNYLKETDEQGLGDNKTVADEKGAKHPETEHVSQSSPTEAKHDSESLNEKGSPNSIGKDS